MSGTALTLSPKEKKKKKQKLFKEKLGTETMIEELVTARALILPHPKVVSLLHGVDGVRAACEFWVGKGCGNWGTTEGQEPDKEALRGSLLVGTLRQRGDSVVRGQWGMDGRLRTSCPSRVPPGLFPLCPKRGSLEFRIF